MGKSFPSRRGRGAPTAQSWKGCSLWGEGPLVGHPFQLPSPPLCPPLRRETVEPHTRPQALAPRAPAALLGGDPRPHGALSLRTKRGWRAAPRRGPGASGGLAARPHAAGPQGGAGAREPGGRVYICEKFPDGRSLPAPSAFPAGGSACPTDEGEVSQKKCPARFGARSRPESLRGKDARPPPRAPPGSGVSRGDRGDPRGYPGPRGGGHCAGKRGWAQGGRGRGSGGRRGCSRCGCKRWARAQPREGRVCGPAARAPCPSGRWGGKEGAVESGAPDAGASRAGRAPGLRGPGPSGRSGPSAPQLTATGGSRARAWAASAPGSADGTPGIPAGSACRALPRLFRREPCPPPKPASQQASCRGPRLMLVLWSCGRAFGVCADLRAPRVRSAPFLRASPNFPTASLQSHSPTFFFY